MAITEKFEVRGDVSSAVAAVERLRSAVARGMGHVERKVGEAGKEIKEKLGGSMLATVSAANLVSNAVTKAFSTVSAAIDASVQSALDYERTMVQQQATLRLFAVDVQGANQLLEAQSTVLERLTGLAQEDIRTMQSRAIALGSSVSQTDDMVRASLALANVLGKDADTAMRALLQSQTGLLNITLKNVPALQKLTKEQLINGDAIKVINEEYGSFVSLATEGGGSAAELTKLSTAWGNLGKAIARAGLESETAKRLLSGFADQMFVWQKRIEAGEVGSIAGETGAKLLSSMETMGPVTFALSKSVSILSSVLGINTKTVEEQAAAYRAQEEAQVEATRAQVEAEELSRAKLGITIDAVTIKVKDQTEQVNKAAQAFDQLVDKWGALPGEDDMRADLARAQGLVQGTPEFVGPVPVLADMHQGQQLELERTAAEGLREIRESNAARRVEAKLWEADEIARINEQMAQQEINTYQTIARIGGAAMQSFASAGLNALETLAAGGEVSAAALAQSVLSSVGKQTLGSGIAHAAQAGAMLFNPATAALGIGLLKQAGVEMAVGSALMAGNLAMIGGGAGAGGSTAASGAGASRGGTGAMGGGTGELKDRSGGAMSTGGITVVINGPTFATEEEIGVAISRAQQAARARGLIQ